MNFPMRQKVAEKLPGCHANKVDKSFGNTKIHVHVDICHP